MALDRQPTSASAIPTDLDLNFEPASASGMPIVDKSCQERVEKPLPTNMASGHCRSDAGVETHDAHERVAVEDTRTLTEDRLRSRIKELESASTSQQEQFRARINELESKCASQQVNGDAQVLSTLKQIERLQGRIDDLEADNIKKEKCIHVLEEHLKRSEQEQREATKSAQATASGAEKALKDAKAVE